VTWFGGGLIQALLPAHVMAIISMGLLGARTKLWPCVGFVAAFAAGLASGLVALVFEVGETVSGDVLLTAALLSGLAAAAAFALPRRVAAATAFVVGCALGLDSPPDAILMREAILALGGTWFGGTTLLVTVLAAAMVLVRFWNGIVLRVAGSWLAAAAILFLAVRWVS
jgi:urease accessory protein